MFSEERKSEILKLLSMQRSVSVNFLAEHFNVSRETIRRDLRQMEEAQELVRTHGGAVLRKEETVRRSSPILSEPPVEARGMINAEIKEKICEMAAAYIQDGDIVYVDNSSTTLYLAKHVSDDIQVTFITNSLLFLTESAKYNKPKQTFICLGGIFKGSNLSTFGDIARQNASGYFPNKAFLSCTGVTALHSITDSSIEETTVKKMMIDSAHEVFLLADHTKFQKNGPIFLSSLDNIHYIITDYKLDNVDYSFINNNGIELFQTNESTVAPC